MFKCFLEIALLLLFPAPRPAPIDVERGPGYMGISYQYQEGTGFLVSEVKVGSPAEASGLLVGDMVVAYDGIKPTDIEHFKRLSTRARPGTMVPLEVLRNGKTIKLKLKVGARPVDFPYPLPKPFFDPEYLTEPVGEPS